MSVVAAIGSGRAVRLLVGLRLRRLLNQMLVSWQVMRRQKVSGERRATAGKARLGWLLAGLVGMAMMFSAFNISSQALSSMGRTLGFVEMPLPSAKASQPMSRLPMKMKVTLPHAPGTGL